MDPYLEEGCEDCHVPAGVRCRPDCPSGLGDYDPAPDNEPVGIGDYPDTLIDGLLEGGGSL